MVNHSVEWECEVSITERLGVDTLAAVMMNFDTEVID